MFNTKTIILLIASMFLAIKFVSKDTHYQATQYGNSGAIIIDKRTGEAWVTDSYEESVGNSTEKIIYLRPIGYCGEQNENYTYLPEDKRNSKNASWLMRLKRIF